MAIADGLRVVDEVLKQPVWDMGRLMIAAAHRAAQELKTKAGLPQGCAFGIDAPCKTYYGVTATQVNQEIVSWFLSILLAEYTAGILALKVREGHCNVHRQPPALNPCPDMPKEHMEMLKAFRDRLKQLVADVDGLILQTPLPVAPQAGPPAAGS